MMKSLINRHGAVFSKVYSLPINSISPNPSQPRREFDEKGINELAESITKYGLIQPITVRQKQNNAYELIAGERRLRAAKLAGLKTIPAIISDVSQERSSLMALIENLQRENLNVFEEAEALERLINSFGLTQDEVAEKIGKSQSTIANKLRLLRLNNNVRDIIIKNGLGERHARALLKLPDGADRMAVLKMIVDKKYNVRQSEEFIERYIKKQNEVPQIRIKPVYVIKDIRIFLNTINHALSVMKRSGIKAQSNKVDNDEFIEYTIRIPKAVKLDPNTHL